MRKVEVFSPARVDFAGGTLDIYPIYLFFNSPFTLNATLSEGVTVSVKRRKGKIVLTNKNSGVSDFFPSYHRDLILITALLEHLKIDRDLEIEFFSSFPQGSSLGVSSSLLVGLFFALKKLLNFRYSRKDIVGILKNVETKVMKYPAGIQDYLAPLYGGMNRFLFNIDGYKVEKIKIFRKLKESTFFVFTGQSHFSGVPNWELFKGFFDKNKKILDGFKMIYNNSKKVFQSIENKDIKLIGKFLKQDFEIRKDMLHSLVPDIDLFDILDGLPGVYGYRLCGAASGGTAVVCADSSRISDIKLFIEKKGYKVFDCELANKKVIVRNG